MYRIHLWWRRWAVVDGMGWAPRSAAILQACTSSNKSLTLPWMRARCLPRQVCNSRNISSNDSPCNCRARKRCKLEFQNFRCSNLQNAASCRASNLILFCILLTRFQSLAAMMSRTPQRLYESRMSCLKSLILAAIRKSREHLCPKNGLNRSHWSWRLRIALSLTSVCNSLYKRKRLRSSSSFSTSVDWSACN